MKCRGWQQLKANAKNGISMAVVLCVSAFFIAFAAAILYTAGMVTAQSNQRLKEERCFWLAKSYAEVLTEELEKYDTRYDTNGNVTGSGTFYAFANKFLDDDKYLEYNSDYKDSTQYHFVVNGTDTSELSKGTLSDQNYGNLSVTLKKEQNTEETQENLDAITNGGTLGAAESGGDYTSAIRMLENTTVRQYILTVEVTAYYKDESYTYTTEYTRAERYPVSFTCAGQTIVWDSTSGSWKEGNSGGSAFIVPEGTAIVYKYMKSSPTLCKFEENNLYQEGDDSGAAD